MRLKIPHNIYPIKTILSVVFIKTCEKPYLKATKQPLKKSVSALK